MTPGRSPTSRPSSSGPTCRPGAEPVEPRPHFWHAQDYAAAAAPLGERRAGRARAPRGVPPPTTRCPASCGAASRPRPASTPGSSTPASARPTQVNASLGRTEIAVLRAVNAALDGASRSRATRRSSSGCWPSGCSPATAASARAPPATWSSSSPSATRDWNAAVAAGGHPVHGDLAELVPLPTPAGTPHPDEVAADVRLAMATDALAELVLTAAADPHPARRTGERTRAGCCGDAAAERATDPRRTMALA